MKEVDMFSYNNRPLLILCIFTASLVSLGFVKDSIQAVDDSDSAYEAIEVQTVVPVTWEVELPAILETTTTVAQESEPAPNYTPAAHVDFTALEPVLTVLLDEYMWGNGGNVEELQEFLGVTVDGDYGSQTRTAHVKLLEGMGWGTDNVPDTPSTGSSTVYNPNATPQCTEWWDTARAAGWAEDRLPRLGRIMFAESRCTHDVVSPTKDYGLTQINWAAHGSRLTDADITRDMLLDPYINLAQAKWIADYAEQHYGCWSQPWYMSGDWC
jgi:hypothetical protein